MSMPPLFWQRWGQSAHRPADLGGCGAIEQLEQRVFLAASATATNVFAQFDGTISGDKPSVTIPLNFSRSNFTFSGKESVLGVQVLAADGSRLDPAMVQIKDAHNRSVSPIFKNANLASKAQSLALADFSAQKYKLIVSAEHHTSGAFQVNLFLAGDAN